MRSLSSHHTAENAAFDVTGSRTRHQKDYGLRDNQGTYIAARRLALKMCRWTRERRAKGGTMLEVTITRDGGVLDEFEWIEEGKPYRKWLIPAAILKPLMIGIRIKGA